jgi:hypothetical protein
MNTQDKDELVGYRRLVSIIQKLLIFAAGMLAGGFLFQGL